MRPRPVLQRQHDQCGRERPGSCGSATPTVARSKRISYKWNCSGSMPGQPWLMPSQPFPRHPRTTQAHSVAGGARPAHPSSGWYLSLSRYALAGSSSPTPTSSKPLTTTSALAGKWDASDAPWLKAKASAIRSARSPDRRPGNRRSIHFSLPESSSCSGFTPTPRRWCC